MYIRTTGYITLKVGKTAAFAVGGGIILLQIAQQKGYVTIDWKKIKEKAEIGTEKVESTYSKDTSKWIEKVRGWCCDFRFFLLNIFYLNFRLKNLPKKIHALPLGL